jgi:hypothetical protein
MREMKNERSYQIASEIEKMVNDEYMNCFREARTAGNYDSTKAFNDDVREMIGMLEDMIQQRELFLISGQKLQQPK